MQAITASAKPVVVSKTSVARKATVAAAAAPQKVITLESVTVGTSPGESDLPRLKGPARGKLRKEGSRPVRGR